MEGDAVPTELPKGFVVNTTDIYREVAAYTTLPTEKIHKYWHVYTTTSKKLHDPTARRLENFWWHVWGNDRRALSGRALAALYEHVSAGPTIAPLLSSVHRWEGPDAHFVTRQTILAHLSRQRDPSLTSTSLAPPPSTTKQVPPTVKPPPCSASKPPPPHPILNKSGGPPTPGPRPTARFVTPTDEGRGSVNGSVGIDARGTAASTSSERRATPAKKKKAATAAAAPGGVRPAAATPTLAKRRPPISRTTSFQTPTLSAKSLGRRPLVQVRTMPTEKSSAAPPLHSPPPFSPSPSRDLSWTRSSVTSTNGRSHQAPFPRQEAAAPRPPQPSPTGPPRRQSLDRGGGGPKLAYALPSSRRLERHHSSQGLWTDPTASNTHVAAQGTIIDQAGSLPAPSIVDVDAASVGAAAAAVQPGQQPLPPGLASPLLQDAHARLRLTPTLPGPSATTVPIGRTRSQLTLLMEREKARRTEKPRFWS